MLAVAIFTVSFLAGRRAHEIGLSKDAVYDFTFWMVLSGVIGCRLFYIFLNFPFFMKNPSELIMIQHGGLAWQGGLIFGLLTAAIFTKVKKINFFKFADFVTPYVALGQSIGRWGCFLNGCCYGKELSWGIYDPNRGVYAHPTQIYLSVAAFISYLILRSFYKRNSIPGRVFALFFLIESISRFTIEFFRADHDILWLGLSIFQVVCIFLFAGSLYAYTFLSRRPRV
jgi:phosphatidylglycerol:prolipoprotein diacylglycerol transferase